MARNVYPHHPGWKGEMETGRDAASAMAAKAPTMRDRCLAALREIGAPATPEMITHHLAAQGQTVLLMSVRPRMSELARLGKVRDSGQRGIGEGGHKAVKWALVEARNDLPR